MSDLDLPVEFYFICNGETFAGRNLKEDMMSLNPKAVTCPTDHDHHKYPDAASILWLQTLWPYSNLVKLLQLQIERLPSGRYRISDRGAPTGERDGLLVAFLTYGDYQAEEWIFTLRKPGLYTWDILQISGCCIQKPEPNICRSIEKANKTGGWVKQEGENPQVRYLQKTFVLVPSEGIGFRSLCVPSLLVPVTLLSFLRISSGVLSLGNDGLENRHVNQIIWHEFVIAVVICNCIVTIKVCLFS